MKININKLKQLICEINFYNSGLFPGTFKDEGTFEAIASKGDYYSTELEFIIGIYLSLQRCHIFHDGNKRTSLGLFQLLLEELNLYIIDEKSLVDLQILYIEKLITEDEFIFGIKILLEESSNIIY